MRAYVFGGSGFIGKYLVWELLRNIHTVINIDLVDLPTHDLSHGTGRYCYYKLDICSSVSSIKDLFFDKPPDIVFVLSAISDIEECEKNPYKAMKVNLLGLTNILDIVSCLKDRGSTKIEKNNFGDVKLPKVVFASSLYAVSANHPYGISKAAGEKLLKWYSKKYGLSYLILRYGTVYGPGASDNNGIKRLVKRSIQQGVVTHYGTGEERREYIHVSDAARSSVELAFSRTNETAVISGSDSIEALRLCTMLNELLNHDGPVFFDYKEPDGHYLVTPYRYPEEEVNRYNPAKTVDFGHGLMEVVKEVKVEENG